MDFDTKLSVSYFKEGIDGIAARRTRKRVVIPS